MCVDTLMISDDTVSQAEELVGQLRREQYEERRCRSEIRKQAWFEYLKRSGKYTKDQLAIFMAGMCVMWRLVGLVRSPLFTYGPDSWPKEVPLDWELGAWVQMNHFEGGLTQPAQIKEFKRNQDGRLAYVRVENPKFQLTGWWPASACIPCDAPND